MSKPSFQEVEYQISVIYAHSKKADVFASTCVKYFQSVGWTEDEYASAINQEIAKELSN